MVVIGAQSPAAEPVAGEAAGGGQPWLLQWYWQNADRNTLDAYGPGAWDTIFAFAAGDFVYPEVDDIMQLTVALYVPSGATPAVELGTTDYEPISDTASWTQLGPFANGTFWISSYWRKVTAADIFNWAHDPFYGQVEPYISFRISGMNSLLDSGVSRAYSWRGAGRLEQDYGQATSGTAHAVPHEDHSGAYAVLNEIFAHSLDGVSGTITGVSSFSNGDYGMFVPNLDFHHQGISEHFTTENYPSYIDEFITGFYWLPGPEIAGGNGAAGQFNTSVAQNGVLFGTLALGGGPGDVAAGQSISGTRVKDTPVIGQTAPAIDL